MNAVLAELAELGFGIFGDGAVGLVEVERAGIMLRERRSGTIMIKRSKMKV